MSRWQELIAGPRGETLGLLLCNAASVAHLENGARFDAEELGDDALIYGLSTTNSARYIAGRRLEDAELPGVAVCRRGRVWWLEVQRRESAPLRVYFYKAPPGARDVYDLRLDDAEVKKELSASNGKQLALFHHAGSTKVELLNLIVVHYGDHESGLEKVDVGAPYVMADRLAWDWHERLDERAAAATTRGGEIGSPLGDDGAGFDGLRLVAEVTAAQTPPESTVEPLELHELALRATPPDDANEAETGQDQR